MENHPIPQDVTGFKFKLIGSVTLKQFLYLLGFGILATIAFVLHINLFIKIPLMTIFALIGAALAFVPIEGRPMDVMFANFAKAIPSENRYIYRKRGANLASFEFFKISIRPTTQAQNQQSEVKKPNDEKRAILLSRLRNSSFRPDENELRFFKNLKSFFEESQVSVQNTTPKEEKQSGYIVPHFIADEEPATALPFSPPLEIFSKEKELAEEEVKKIQKALEETKQMQAEKAGTKEDLAAKILELEKQLSDALKEKETLAKQVVEYESNKIKKGETVFKPGQAEEREETQNVHFVSPASSLKAGFPSLPDIPNIVLGIVRDSRNKTLPNILVEVMDANSIPVRAFKTNALGQFASATPLPNGTYKVYFEDPQKQHEFEVIEITLNGDIFNPIEVVSVDAREKLRRELFESSQVAV